MGYRSWCDIKPLQIIGYSAHQPRRDDLLWQAGTSEPHCAIFEGSVNGVIGLEITVACVVYSILILICPWEQCHNCVKVSPQFHKFVKNTLICLDCLDQSGLIGNAWISKPKKICKIVCFLLCPLAIFWRAKKNLQNFLMPIICKDKPEKQNEAFGFQFDAVSLERFNKWEFVSKQIGKLVLSCQDNFPLNYLHNSASFDNSIKKRFSFA